MKEAGKGTAVVEEVCSTDNLDKEAYEQAREKAAKVLAEAKADTLEKRNPISGKNKNKRKKKQNWLWLFLRILSNNKFVNFTFILVILNCFEIFSEMDLIFNKAVSRWLLGFINPW